MINKKLAEKIQKDLETLQPEAEHYHTLYKRVTHWRKQSDYELSRIMYNFWGDNARKLTYNIVKKYLAIIKRNGIEKIETETERKQLSKQYNIDKNYAVKVSIGSNIIFIFNLYNNYSSSDQLIDGKAYFNGKTNDYETHKEYDIAKLDDEMQHYTKVKSLIAELKEAEKNYHRLIDELRNNHMSNYLDEKKVEKRHSYL